MAQRLSSFLAELKRRKVYHVGVAYVVVGLGILGAAELILDPLELGPLRKYIVILVLLGFPIALVLAWAYEVRPEEPRDEAGRGPGLRREGGDVSAETSGAAPGPSAEMDPVSIVVLPLENLSPDPDNAFFADGLTEEIITDLSKVRALRVISRTSAMAFKGTPKTIPEIADQLNVRFVLEGSVRREAQSLRITAQLIDASSDAHLWAEKYSGTLEDVFDLQEQLSRRIVDALKVKLSPEEDRRLADRPLTDIQAHDIWLRARQHTLTLTTEGSERAKELVEQALAIAGDNALLHATLGWVHAVRWGQVEEGADEELTLLKEHASKAMALDPDLPWSLFSQAIVHARENDLQGFARWGKKVLEIERDSHTLAVLSFYLTYSGRTELARKYAEEAASLDPLSWLTTCAVPFADVHDGQAGPAFESMRGLAEHLAPGESWPAFEAGYAALQAGLEEEAGAWLQRSVTGKAQYYKNFGNLHLELLQGDQEGALRVLRDTAVVNVARRAGVGSYRLGACFAQMRMEGEALGWIDRAIDQGFTNHRFMAEHDRLLDPLRGDPRFEALVARAREVEGALEI